MASGLAHAPPRRSAPFNQAPGFYPDARIWLYGNAWLLGSALTHVPRSLGRLDHSLIELDLVEQEAEVAVLSGKVLVAGIHSPAHQRVAIPPLKWGAPRILVLPGGFLFHLGARLKDEPFPLARLWRFEFDPSTDLVISRSAPDAAPGQMSECESVDADIQQISDHSLPGALFQARG